VSFPLFKSLYFLALAWNGLVRFTTGSSLVLDDWNWAELGLAWHVPAQDDMTCCGYVDESGGAYVK
jgi:hypothetical protein